MRNLIRAGLLSGLLLIAIAAPAQGATTIGGTVWPGNGVDCLTGYSAIQSAGTSYAAPTAGVITSWRYWADDPAPTMKFKVYRPAAPFTVVDQTAAVTPPTDVITSFPARISVQAGDLIGATYTAGGPCTGPGSAPAGDAVSFGSGDAANGGSQAFTFATVSPLRLDLAASLEADGDADGYGDETQDNCPAVSNPTQTNTDGDGQGNACDADDDNDDVADTGDACPVGGGAGVDTDGDGCKDAGEDGDDDNDTIPDSAPDNCPLNANTNQANNDGDAQGDVCDSDDDNDGKADGSDACPLGAGPGVDTDGDGCKDAGEDGDDDNDGKADGSDACPTTAATTSDGCPAGQTPDGQIPDGQTPDGQTPDGQTPGGQTPDTTAPDVRILSGPGGKTRDTTPTFTFSTTDPTAKLTCSMDGRAAVACTSPFTSTKLKKGPHTFAVTATDAAGNKSAAATQSFKVKKKKKRHH